MFDETPLVMVEDAATLAEVVATLSKAPVIGIDTESDSSYTYQEKVCLIQLSDLHTDFVIDPLAVKDLSSLAPILADRSIVKILHGADYDVVCLRRDHDFRIRGLFDTLVAAQLLGMERIGLADLILRFFGVQIDKQYQRHNWGLRPLRPEHVEYARGDTHYLLALREIILPRLRRAGRLRHMREECRLLEQREWRSRPFDPDGFLDVKQATDLDDRGKRVLRHLYLYRDQQARRLDRPVYKVIPDAMLVALARHRPTSSDALDDVLRKSSALRRRHGSALLDVVAKGLDDDSALPRKSRGKPRARKRTPLKTRLRGRQAERVLGELKNWRNHLLQSDKDLTPFTVASNSTLRQIAVMRPRDLEELALVPEVRQWQVEDFGTDLLALLDRIAPEDG